MTDNAKDINKTNNTNIQSIILPESEGMPTYSIKLDSSGRKELFDALSDCDELGLHDGVMVESSGNSDSWKALGNDVFTYAPDINAMLLYKDKESIKKSSSGVYYNYELICFVIGYNTHKEKLNKGAEMIISA